MEGDFKSIVELERTRQKPGPPRLFDMTLQLVLVLNPKGVENEREGTRAREEKRAPRPRVHRFSCSIRKLNIFEFASGE